MKSADENIATVANGVVTAKNVGKVKITATNGDTTLDCLCNSNSTSRTTKPGTGKPEISNPETSNPETNKPETSTPETNKPETKK